MCRAGKSGPACHRWRSMGRVGPCCCGICRNKASAAWVRSVTEAEPSRKRFRQVHGEEQHQRDVWHLFHVAAQVQGRLDRAVQAEQARLLAIQRQADALANGIRRRGRRPKATLAEQEACLSQMSYVADGVRYLCQELHTLLEVVVPLSDCLLSSEHRQGEIVTVLELLDELVPSATAALQGQLRMLAKQVRLALPQTLLFARRLDAIQEQASRVLGAEAVALLAWAWLRRAVLGPTS